MGKCLYCYKELKEGQVDYHPACAQKLYGTRQVPHLPYVRSEIGDLAKQVVRARTTLTGAQAKLSLDVRPGGKNSCCASWIGAFCRWRAMLYHPTYRQEGRWQ